MLGHFGQAGLQRGRKKNPNYHKNAHTYGSLEHMLLLRLVFYVFMVKMNEKINFLYTVKVSKSQKQNCRAKTSSKNERTNLFFYPDGPEILETWNWNLKFQIIPDCQDRKTNSSVRFWKKFFSVNFAFEIYWPLTMSTNFQHTVCINNVEVRTVKPGTYKHTITGLTPNTVYRVTVRAKNIKASPFVDEKSLVRLLEKLSAHTEFRTLNKGKANNIFW